MLNVELFVKVCSGPYQSRQGMTIYHDLKLDKLDCTVAIIKNAKSNKMGKRTSSRLSARLKIWIWISLVSSITISP